MSPPVFLVDALPEGAEAVLAGAEGHHAVAVRRLRPGAPVRLSDGAGGVAECTVARIDASRLILAVHRRGRLDPPRPRFVVVQAVAKGDRGELAVQLLTEVGVDEVVPWAAARSVVVWRDDRAARAVARWRATAREAAKQSRRAWVPTVTEPHSTAQVAARIAAAGGGLVLDADAEATLAAAPLPAGRDAAGHGVWHAAGHVAGDAAEDIVVVVGPEGGITADELAACTAAGARPVRLGPAILRTSTAGAAALAVLSLRTGRWC